MYYDFSVDIPSVKGKIIKKPKGNTTYVLFEYGRKYNAEKKYSVPQRTIIGKLVPEDPARMYPNDNFQDFFPDVVLPEERPAAYRSCCLKIGAYIIIRKVLEEYKLLQTLRGILGDDTGLFLDLMSFLIVEEENVAQHYPDFAFNHPLFSDQMTIYSDVKISRMLSSITRDQALRFQDEWNKDRDHKQRIYLSYDSTNKNSDAGDVDLVEFGKAKDDKGVPVFNISLAFDKSNQIPLFYEEYPGSITDVSQFTFMVDKVTEYGYKKIGFILDRGYFSKENIQYIDENGYEFIIMVKGCKSLVSSLIAKHRGSFETSREHSIRPYKVYGKTVRARLYEDDDKDRFFQIYFNPAKAAAEREKLEQKIDRYKVFLEKHIGEETRFGKTYKEYFRLTYNKRGRLVSVVEKTEVVQQQLELCGYFSIVTSERMTAAEALIQYKGRDVSEKLFRSDKSFLGSSRERVHTSERYSSKLFVEFIALIVRNRIYNLLKETVLRMSNHPNYMTVPAAIRELEKIEMVQRSRNGRYRLDHAISKRQKTILGSFGIDEANVQSIATEIGTMLATSKSLMDYTEEEDGQEEEYLID